MTGFTQRKIQSNPTSTTSIPTAPTIASA